MDNDKYFELLNRFNIGEITYLELIERLKDNENE